MKYQITAPRKRAGLPRPDTRENVRKLVLTATDEVDEVKLSLLAYALCPLTSKRDKLFDRWLTTRIAAYLKRTNQTIVRHADCMNKWLIVAVVLAGCNADESQHRELAEQNARLKQENKSLESSIISLKRQDDALRNSAILLGQDPEKIKQSILSLRAEEAMAKKDRQAATCKYVLTVSLSQSHITLDLWEHAKDSMNTVRFKIPVDKDYYDHCEVGRSLNNDFRFGSLLMNGSFGSWSVTVVGKDVVNQ